MNMMFGSYGKSPLGVSPFTSYHGAFVQQRSKFQKDLRAGQGITHRYFRGHTNFPFGFGLHYTNFSYTMAGGHGDPGDVHMTTAYTKSPSMHAVVVSNIGTPGSERVVLVFLASDMPSAPLQTLFDFERIRLAAEQSQRLLFTPSALDMSTVDDDGQMRRLEATIHTLRIGDVVTPAESQLKRVGPSIRLQTYPTRGTVRLKTTDDHQ